MLNSEYVKRFSNGNHQRKFPLRSFVVYILALDKLDLHLL